MQNPFSTLLPTAALCLTWATGPALAQGGEEQALADTVARLESSLDARIGVAITQAGNDWHWDHRADERFPMASTFKTMLCGAVLERVDEGTLSLDEELLVRPEEIFGHAPVTNEYAGEVLSIGTLCHATLDQSDNGAANLLIDRLGSPQDITDFMRGLGDTATRMDRKEPELNSYTPGDPQDTTTPAAMVASWETVLIGEVLSPASREQLIDWMADGGVTGALIRPHLPEGWTVADKSGAGDTSRNLVAMLTPRSGAPYFVALYISDAETDFATRNAALQVLAEVTMDAVLAHDATPH